MGSNILLVEDNPGDADLVAERLSGRSITVAATLDAALQVAASAPIDVVLLDLGLPDSSGLETLRRFASAQPLLPIVVLTGTDDDELGREAIKAGAQDYLCKNHISRQILERALAYAAERQRLRDQARRAEIRFRALLESTPGIVAELTPAGEVREVYGQTPDVARLLGDHWLDAAEGDADRGARRTALERACSGDSEVSLEARVQRDDGTERWYAMQLAPLADGSSQSSGAVLVALDETAQRRERALFEQALEGTACAMLLVDAERQIVLANAASEAVFGYAPGELVGTRADRLIQAQSWTATDRASRSIAEAVVATRKDGEPIDLLVGMGPITLNGEPHVVCSAVDISEHKRLEEMVRKSQKLEAVGRLAGGVAHDFNNLLTVIIGLGEFVKEEIPPDTSAGQDVDALLEAAGKAAHLVSQLLAYSRRRTIKPEVFDPNALVEQMSHLLERSLGEDIALATVLDPAAKPIRVDGGAFEQVLVNFAFNARDAMPDGGKLTIETGSTAIDAGYRAAHNFDIPSGDYTLLLVSDTGTGMSEEVRSRIFEPFFTTKESGKGSGLGLATCHGIVRQAGGDIWVYSEPGVGTVFKVFLPSAEGECKPPEPAPRPESDVERNGRTTILLVDDEQHVRNIAVRSLKREGYRVLVASRGEEAVALACDHPIDLLVSDVIMPSLNGPQVAARILEHQPDVRVLYISGYTAEVVARHGVLERDVELLSKPFSPDALVKRVNALLQ